MVFRHISISALLKPAILVALPLLLTACIFTVDPVLDETNSTAGKDSANFSEFLKAWRFAYGENYYPEFPFPKTYFLGEGGNVDLSSIRVVPLENGLLLVQQKLQQCISDHCFVYYGARMREPWWPESCLASTAEDDLDALQTLAARYGVTLTMISEGDKSPPDFGMDGSSDSLLRFLQTQFTEGTLSCTGDGGVTPLHWAAWGVTSVGIAALIQGGVDVNARIASDGDVLRGLTPLHLALLHDNSDSDSVVTARVVALIEGGADVNARLDMEEDIGLTPLHMAAAIGTPADIAALMAAGADINARIIGGDHSGATPLHMAAQTGSPTNVEALLDAGADGRLRDDAGKTPLDIAKENQLSALTGTDAYRRLERAQ